jgi:hypothetical protein
MGENFILRHRAGQEGLTIFGLSRRQTVEGQRALSTVRYGRLRLAPPRYARR